MGIIEFNQLVSNFWFFESGEVSAPKIMKCGLFIGDFSKYSNDYCIIKYSHNRD